MVGTWGGYAKIAHFQGKWPSRFSPTGVAEGRLHYASLLVRTVGMDYGRIVLSAVAATLVFFTYGFLVHGLLIAKDYIPYPEGVYRAGDAARSHMPFGLAGIFIVILVFATIYFGALDGLAQKVLDLRMKQYGDKGKEQQVIDKRVQNGRVVTSVLTREITLK